MPWIGLQCVIVVFPDHAHLQFWLDAQKQRGLFSFFKKKETEKDTRNGNTKEYLVIHRHPGNHTITTQDT